MSVYVFGSNKYGELGSCKSSSLHEPRMLDIFDGQSPIIACAAGEGHSLCVSESGDVYSFGRGHDGQLGLGKNKTKINIDVPTLIAELQHESIVNVCAGAVSSYAISANGRVYQWYLR
jgi:RCC1 and BTB domain-containing protein